jgi:hypothetical protein
VLRRKAAMKGEEPRNDYRILRKKLQYSYFNLKYVRASIKFFTKKEMGIIYEA